MTTSPTSPRIALLSSGAQYTIPELREGWRVAAHIAHREIHHALLAGELFVTDCDPLTYSRTPPAVPPELPLDWQAYLATLLAQSRKDRILLYHDLLKLWTGDRPGRARPSNASPRRLRHRTKRMTRPGPGLPSRKLSRNRIRVRNTQHGQREDDHPRPPHATRADVLLE